MPSDFSNASFCKQTNYEEGKNTFCRKLWVLTGASRKAHIWLVRKCASFCSSRASGPWPPDKLITVSGCLSVTGRPPSQPASQGSQRRFSSQPNSPHAACTPRRRPSVGSGNGLGATAARCCALAASYSVINRPTRGPGITTPRQLPLEALGGRPGPRCSPTSNHADPDPNLQMYPGRRGTTRPASRPWSTSRCRSWTSFSRRRRSPEMVGERPLDPRPAPHDPRPVSGPPPRPTSAVTPPVLTSCPNHRFRRPAVASLDRGRAPAAPRPCNAEAAGVRAGAVPYG